MQERKALRAVISGIVQAVGFRQFVILRARGLGLSGYVRNGDDGRSVEVVAEGPGAALEELLQYVAKGPFLARVDDVQVSWSKETSEFERFEVRW
ncbi:MAG: acylphosphatase [Dehalococcoidia bacterium]|jgi:acylphosphatase